MSKLSIVLLSVAIVVSSAIVNAASRDPPEAILNYTPNFFKRSMDATYPSDSIVSPFTSWNALVMLSQAAKANTYQQLIAGLKIKKNKAKVAKQMPKFYRDMEDDAGSADLTIFNEIFVQKGHKLDPASRQVATKKFNAGIQKVNFTEERSGYAGWPAATTINDFVKAKTNNTIQDVVRPVGALFSADTRAVLVDGAYFSGEWARSFDPQRSYWGQFNGVPINYMNVLDTFNHADLPDLYASAVEMEYANSDYGLVIVMPNVDLYALQNALQIYDWSKITKQMQPKYVDLTVPKSRSYFQLSNIEANLGMTDMFTNTSNLKGLLESSERLKVFELHHSSSIRTNELGAEAAAATSVQTNTFAQAAQPACEPVVQFNANRPFVYFLRNRIDDTILFSGRLVRPVLG